MSEVREFKTESKRLLDLMINSIYTNKEIFLRELISNASDAIDKYHYMSLTEDKLPKKNDYEINLSYDTKKRTFTIKDNGIGMTYDELVNSLGTIAKSGSLEFMEKLKDEKNKDKIDVDIIGQFGVGFYSAFMVASKVEVKTRSLYDEKAYKFVSEGEETYTIDEIEKEDSGTEITLYLRKNSDDYDYDKFLDEWTIKSLVKQYSDYIRYPIKMEVTKSVKKEGTEDEYEDKKEVEILNAMTPIWKKNKNDVTDEEYNNFYMQKYYDYKEPLFHILLNVEGKVNYTALLYVPSVAPYNLYSEKYEKGLQLYSKGVFIMDKCKELIPDYFRFVKGLVDSSDLSLNISRELLQKSKELKEIAENVEKKLVSKLENIMKNDFDTYLKFFEVFGINLKFGVYDEFGAKKDLLKDLIIYHTTNQEKMISLKEYVEAMPKDQKVIYYASAKTKEQVLAMPQMDLIKKHNYDVLVLPDDVDEFLIQILREYDGHKFQSVNQGDLDLLDKDEEEKIKELNTQKKPLLDAMKEALKDEVSDVVISKRLTDSAVCLVSTDGVSFEMEKVLNQMPNANGDVKAGKVLELNPNHELFKAIEEIYIKEPQEIANLSDLLYNQALLVEGFSIKNPVEFSKKMCDLIIKASK
ncbi:MAG: molecular chaperone HtpG [Bacilli bacterium]|nr:molecular chaperone HtpG [Bacilli bacterium]